jgi:hypothetical protein
VSLGHMWSLPSAACRRRRLVGAWRGTSRRRRENGYDDVSCCGICMCRCVTRGGAVHVWSRESGIIWSGFLRGIFRCAMRSSLSHSVTRCVVQLGRLARFSNFRVRVGRKWDALPALPGAPVPIDATSAICGDAELHIISTRRT